MNLHGVIACICEGSGEQAIIELLLENNQLCFERKNLLDEKIIRVRAADKFEEMYLRKDFNEKITVLRILDSRREKFNLRKLYQNKIEVINIITAPEIEMLIIHNEGKYDDFKKSSEKPSEYCKRCFKYHNVKSYKFVREYFSDIEVLLNAIKQYHRIAKIQSDEKSLYDLLKDIESTN
ncbi:MAG: hypothetical protein RSD40_04090 [Bacilli bacterium]